MKKPLSVHTHRRPRPPANPLPAPAPDPVLELFAPLFEARSYNLFTTMETMVIEGRRYPLPKLLLLGARGGGVPMKVGLFSGLEAGRTETVAAMARLMMQFDLTPDLARDYAIISYPAVNVPGLHDAATAAGETLEQRWQRRPDEDDAHYFRAELGHLGLHGVITFRLSDEVSAFTAATRSSLFADEILEATLRTLSALVPVAPVVRWKDNREAREAAYAAGGLLPHPALRPWPFEVEFTVPATLDADLAVSALHLATVHVLRTYRVFVSQQAEL